MAPIPTPFGRGNDGGDDLFDAYDEFVPAHVPEPGPFLADHDVLGGRPHLAFHRLTMELFGERGVYDMTFGYNLARLNLDTRHPDAGYRYAVDSDDPTVLRAEFTPTTPFCPQSDTLTKGSFRAWNGLADRHEFDLVSVRVHPMHQRSEAINAALAELQEKYLDSGDVHVVNSLREGLDDATGSGGGPGCADGSTGTTRGYGPDAPF
ncbi:MAG: hypothetical protein ABEJ31_11205 [Haloarculaceae archaeon]